MTNIVKIFLLLALVTGSAACKIHAQEIDLVTDGTSKYKIILPAEPTPLEQKSANVLQKYIEQATGCRLLIDKENKKHIEPAIYIGETVLGDKAHHAKLAPEGYLLFAQKKYIFIKGGSGKGLIYGVYTFLETYLHCLKIAEGPAIVPNTIKTIKIPGDLNDEHKAQFEYREVYYPDCHDAEFVEWNKLHKFEDLWGLWGHSYDKLVPAKTWFKTHPEYYALVKGVRQSTQLCLSNNEVYKLVLSALKIKMAANPDAMYWSISPNDDMGYCECSLCKAIDDREGSPSGSLINFVNKVAKEFPDKKITTLAYGFTHKAPKNIAVASNVYVFLSNIDAYRDKPLADEGSANGFRNDLRAWAAVTPNIFIWDYITQFTNYLAPFPNLHTLQANMQFYKDNGVKGIFEQGSGDTYGEFAELRGYLVAKLLWDAKADVKALTYQFLANYYTAGAAKYIQEYIELQQAQLLASKRKLDIYGNPVNEYNSWLSPTLIDNYSSLFDKAEVAAQTNALNLSGVALERVTKARLPLEYTVLQQARFYGIEKHGVFIKDDNGEWVVKPLLKEKIAKFVTNCKKAGVTELSEGGLTPDQYQAEWDNIFKTGVTPNLALGADVTFKYPFSPDYPAKGNKTLVDGTPGYHDFSYNWLCFYGVPLEATINLPKPQKPAQIRVGFLDDPRHWIFLPESINIEISKDGTTYSQVAQLKLPKPEEHYENETKYFTFPVKLKKGETIKSIKVTAANQPTLPTWRTRDNKKPMIACDEVFVE